MQDEFLSDDILDVMQGWPELAIAEALQEAQQRAEEAQQ